MEKIRGKVQKLLMSEPPLLLNHSTMGERKKRCEVQQDPLWKWLATIKVSSVDLINLQTRMEGEKGAVSLALLCCLMIKITKRQVREAV